MNQRDWKDIARNTWNDRDQPEWEQVQLRGARNEFNADTVALAAMPVDRTLRFAYAATSQGYSGVTNTVQLPAGDECKVSLLREETGGQPHVDVVPTTATMRGPHGRHETRFVVHFLIVQIPPRMFVVLQVRTNT